MCAFLAKPRIANRAVVSIMGKAIPKGIKARAYILLEKFPESFGTDYEKNKQFVNSLELPLFKTNRNLIVGFITRQVKQKIAKAA